jgi:hypothetical protein
MQTPPNDDQLHFQNVDPRLRDEVGGILERAFKREDGHIPDAMETQALQSLANEAQQKAAEAERLAEEAEMAARQASERYALSHAQDDLESVQRWEAEAASYRREKENYLFEVERLRKYLPG